MTLILVLLLAAATVIGVYLADHQKEDEGNPIRSEEEMEQSSDKHLEDDPDNTQSQDQDEQNTDADTSESLEENNPDNTQKEDNASSDGNSSEENYQQLVWPLPVASVMSSIISDTWASKTMSRIWAGNSRLWAIRTKRL